MKILNFKTLILCFVIGLVFVSCSKENLSVDTLVAEDGIELIDTETDIEERAPKILVDAIEPGSCCSGSWSQRRVTITLDPLTHSFFNVNYGGPLYYKFYNANNPCAAPISKTSSSASPTFCLPGNREYVMFICSSNGGCALDCSGGSLSIPNGVPTSGPMYSFSLNACGIIYHEIRR